MIEGSTVKLRMKKVMKKGMILDKQEYTCIVDSYDYQDEKLVIKVEDGQLHKLMLDAKYQCDIFADTGGRYCEGIIKERFQSEHGSLLIFYIENGFYEITTD